MLCSIPVTLRARDVQTRASFSSPSEGKPVSTSPKFSPFILSTEALDRLTAAAIEEPAVLDLVGGYLAAQENLEFYADQVAAELEHYGVSAS
jgi:hypothetical protein